MTEHNKKLIRNSTAEFLIFTGQAGEKNIEARYENGTVWLTQKLMASLFEVKEPATYNLLTCNLNKPRTAPIRPYPRVICQTRLLPSCHGK
jgi:hypothetical protein